jgi:ADP-ribose pyrophosphatase YjhB (NUDIX family)
MRRDDPRHIVGVAGVVRDDTGRVLLVRTGRRGWEQPGGQVELGEDLKTALQREIREAEWLEVACVPEYARRKQRAVRAQQAMLFREGMPADGAVG